MYADSVEKYKYLSELTEADIKALTQVLDSKVVADRVQETVYELGTSDIVLNGDGTNAGYIPFASVMSHGDTCSYVIEGVKKTLQCNGQFEIGIGVWNANLNTLVRKTVVYSNMRDNVSGGYQKINFVADREPYNGFHRVWISLSAADIKSWQSVIKAFSQDVLYVRDVLETIEQARADALNNIDDRRQSSIDTMNSLAYGVKEDGTIRTEYEEGQTEPSIMTDIATLGNSYTTLMVVTGDEYMKSLEDQRLEESAILEAQYSEYVETIESCTQSVEQAHADALVSIDAKVDSSKTILDSHTGLRINEINDRYSTIDSLIVSQGDTQVSRVQTTGDTQNNRVISTGTSWNNTVTASGQLAVSDIETVGGTWKTTIETAGDDWNKKVIASGELWDGTVIATGTEWNTTVSTTGDTQNNRVISTGTSWNNTVTNTGNTQNTRVTNTGNTWNNTVNTSGQTIFDTMHGYAYGYDENDEPRDSYVSGTNDDGVLYDIEQAGRIYIASIVVDGNAALDKISEHATVAVNNMNTIVENFNNTQIYEKQRNIGYRVLDKGTINARNMEFDISEAYVQKATFDPASSANVDIVLSGASEGYTYKTILALYNPGSITLTFPPYINWVNFDGKVGTSEEVIGYYSPLPTSGLVQISIWNIGENYYGSFIYSD